MMPVSIHGFCGYCNTAFEAVRCFYQFCPNQAARASLTEKEIQRCNKERATRLQ